MVGGSNSHGEGQVGDEEFGGAQRLEEGRRRSGKGNDIAHGIRSSFWGVLTVRTMDLHEIARDSPGQLSGRG